MIDLPALQNLPSFYGVLPTSVSVPMMMKSFMKFSGKFLRIADSSSHVPRRRPDHRKTPIPIGEGSCKSAA
jgi:hypothetical protein